MSRRGHPPVLDARKKAEILAILAVGCPRRIAAQYVGCDLKTLYNTALRDPEFQENMHKNEVLPEVYHLANLKNAGRETRYWRASAWYLERADPERFGTRSPDTLTKDEVSQIISQFSKMMMEEVPVARFRKQMIKRLDAMTSEMPDNLERRYNQGKYSYPRNRKLSSNSSPQALPNAEKPQNSRVQPAGSNQLAAKTPENHDFSAPWPNDTGDC